MRLQIISLLAAFLASAPGATGLSGAAPQACAPPSPPAGRVANIFTEAQEVHLGDAIAEQIQRNFRVIDNDEITGPLKQIGARLARRLPATQLNFRFFLIDLPEVNAFVLPGGRIYVARKLIAFAESEDELAGVLAHEIGHLVARQQTQAATRQFKEVLGVTSVTDRADIFEKHNRLIENAARKPGAFRVSAGHEDADQIAADRIGLFAAAAAGYDPQASIALWDRYTGTEGKTGSLFSDLLGVTRPESRRLREMIRALATLPASCVDPPAGDGGAFRAWQSAVMTYSGVARKESLEGVVSRVTLEPPLRGDVTHLRFSPDGRHVLAQDDSGVDVLSRDPFVPLFRIPAEEASRAQFTPDSEGVVFYNSGMRVELWSIAGRRLKEARELFLRSPCVQTALSPTGRTFACLDADLALNVIDVASGKMVYRKKEFSEPNRLEALAMILGSPRGESGVESENASLLAMGFSTDGRYFAASEKATAARLLGPGTANVVVDIEKGDTISVKGPAQRLLAGGFAFIGPDRFIALNVENTKKSAIVALPLGNVVSEFPMPPGQVTPVSRGRYLVARPFAQHAAAIIDMDKGEVLRGSESPAIDVYDGVIVSERLNGELGLYPIDSNALAASAQLPGSTLGDLQAMAVSEDFRWLAASERTRGAAWNIENGKRVALTRGFRNAAINTDGAFTADFPAFRQIARQLARMDLNQANAPTFREMPAGAAIRQYGDLLVGAKSKGASVTYTVSDARTLQNLWTRTFQDGSPDVLVGSRYGTIVLVWPLDAKGAQAAVKNNPALLQRAKNLKNEGAVFLEVVDARSGAVKGNVLLDTGRGSFAIQAALAAGGWIAIADDQNRILLYSLATGEKKGQVFGGRAAIGAGNGLISVENEDGRLTIYDLNTLEKRAEFVFTARVAFAQFSPDGRKLFVLTADQTAFVLNAPAPASR